MKFLLDTHLILWVANNSAHLSKAARKLINDPHHQLFFSVVNLWEISIKSNLGRKDFYVDARILRRELLNNDYQELSLTGEHALAVGELPLLHRDPFDRMLIAQANSENMTLLTSDILVSQYPGNIRKV